MRMNNNEQEPITFLPSLRADDSCANYWMRQVTIRLRREICWLWHKYGVTSDSKSWKLPPFRDKVPEILDINRFWEEKNKFYQTDTTARFLTQQLAEKPPHSGEFLIHGSFGWVVERLNLDEISSFILALGLTIAFDNTVGSVVAACLNDPGKTHPNLALAQKLWDHPEQFLFAADPAYLLFRYGLLQHNGQTSHNYSEVDWESPIVVPSLVANQLLFPSLPLTDALIPLTIEDNTDCADNNNLVISRLSSENGDMLRIVPIRGPNGSALVETVRGIAKGTKKRVVKFNGDASLLENGNYLRAIMTLCWLKNADLFLDKDMASILNDDRRHQDIHLSTLQWTPVTLFLGITERSQLDNIPGHLLLPIVDVPEFSYNERINHWKKMLGVKTEGLDSAISECSRRFRYEKETINAICKGLKGLSNPITKEVLFGACRAELELDIGELAQKIIPRFKDEKLILPYKQSKQFEEIINAMNSLTEVHYGWETGKTWNESGISVLFAGPPGTGKTMGAEILAIKLNLPMYRIDLSQVVNKYIGETEKNLKRLFDAADISDTILFFDEADALFGRRTEVKDAHDRYANLEVSYLLERMERFKGLAILATNRKKDLDEAFLRRLRYIIPILVRNETYSCCHSEQSK